MTSAADQLGIPASHHDLVERPLVASLTTVGTDGLLQSTAVWYLLHEGELAVSIRTDRQKYRNLLANPVATLLIVDPDNQVRTLELRCHTSLRPDPGKAFSEQFTAKYGHAPSTWDPAGTERAVITLHTKRVVTLG